MIAPPDADWVPAVEHWCAGPVTVVARTPLTGGYASPGVLRIDLDVAGRSVAVALKRGTEVEIAAMRALAAVSGVDRPRMIASGCDEVGVWLLIPLYPGTALRSDDDVPPNVWSTLARVHRHWLRRRPPGLPVLDAEWWQALCEERIVPALAGAARRSDDRVFAPALDSVTAMARDPRMAAALALLPKTLVHGDAHRGNILRCPDGGMILDWGNAKLAPPGLDLAVFRAQGASDSACYAAEFADAHADADPRHLAVERHWADVHINVAYLGFAADHLGADRVGTMITAAASGLIRLDDALCELR